MATVVAYFFDQAKPYLKAELSKASKSIQVAVAWFTDEDLMAKLMDLKYQHKELSIQVLISNSTINVENPRYLQRMQASGIELRVMRDDASFLHHKFCLIDDNVLINGSYNWTYRAANKNEENITIIKPDSPNDAVIVQFKSRFLRLFKEQHSRPFSPEIAPSDSPLDLMSDEHEQIELRKRFQDRVQRSLNEIERINSSLHWKKQIHIDLIHDMIKRYGDGVAMVEKLIKDEGIPDEKGQLQPKSGFKKLVDWGRQRDLSFESIVLDADFQSLFSEDVKNTARRLLR